MSTTLGWVCSRTSSSVNSRRKTEFRLLERWRTFSPRSSTASATSPARRIGLATRPSRTCKQHAMPTTGQSDTSSTGGSTRLDVMKRSSDRILTTHPGRLPNPDNQDEIVQARNGDDQEKFDALTQ